MADPLKTIRAMISTIDGKIIRLVARRQSYMPKVAALKKKDGIPILQSGREAALLKSHKALAKKLGVSTKLIEDIFKLVFKDSRRIQSK